MAGPSGFVQRFKGKVSFPVGGIWIAGTAVTSSAADLNSVSGQGTLQVSTSTSVTLTSGGVKNLAPAALSGGTVYPLADPVAGRRLVINYSTLNGSTIVFIKTSSDRSVFIAGVGSTGSTASFAGSGGTTISYVIKSTQSCVIEMVGQSSVSWLFMGVSPSTVGALTFSTTT